MAEAAGYIKIQKDLRNLIIQGVYGIGDLLPSENELSSQYGFSRMTIRNALKNLETEGLISKKKGKGSIVRLKRKSIELLSIRGFTQIMKSKAKEIDSIILQKPVPQPWKNGFYWNLSELEQLAGCIYFSRIRMVQEKPIMMEETYLGNLNLPRFCSTPFLNKSLFDTLVVNYDIEMTDVVQKFRAIPASKEIAKGLLVSEGAPVLEIIRKLKTSRPGFNVYSFAYCNTDEFTIEA